MHDITMPIARGNPGQDHPGSPDFHTSMIALAPTRHARPGETRSSDDGAWVPWVVIPVLVLGGVLILRRALNSSGPKRAEALVAGVLVAAMFFGLSVVVLVLAVEDMQWRADAPARKAAAERDRKMLDDLVAEHAREAERQFHERMAPAQPTATGTTPAEPTP